jgi:hypothetical protein
MSMISNAEIYSATRGMVRGRRTREMLEAIRVEYPGRSDDEITSAYERTRILLTDLHKVDVIASRIVKVD